MAQNDLQNSAIAESAGHGGLPCIRIENAEASAEIYLHGATITHFQPVGQKPLIFVSKQAIFDGKKPIRGGVPICWPWFGPHPSDPKLPQHGTVRTRAWSLKHAGTLPDRTTRVTLALETPEAALEYEVTVGRLLTMRLTTTNRSAAPLTITEALHTYFVVGGIKHVSVHGLQGVEYFDRVTQGRLRDDQPEIRFTGEFDRTYLNTHKSTEILDPAMGRKIHVTKSGSASTVVWNPWIAKAKAIADLGDDEWQDFVCVETANGPGNDVTIAPGASSAIQASLTIE